MMSFQVTVEHVKDSPYYANHYSVTLVNGKYKATGTDTYEVGTAFRRAYDIVVAQVANDVLT